MSTNAPFMNAQAPTNPSTAPLVGIYNVDQMPPLTFATGAVVGVVPGNIYNVAANTTGFTATAQQVAGASFDVLNLTGALGAGANIQLPTVASLSATLGSNIQTTTYTRLRIINSSSGAFAWTVTTNTGWTLNGTMSIAQNTWREFFVTITASSSGIATAATLQAIGTGTQS